jgi:uncharacterized protein YqhQ
LQENCNKSFHYGGQAIIEGVMMRGKKHFSVACRRATGEITVTSEPVEKGILGGLKWLNKPFLRGTLALADSLILGMRSLMWSANLAMEDEQAKADAEKAAKQGGSGDAAPVVISTDSKPKSNKVNEMALSATMFLSLGIAIIAFMYAPALLTKWLGGKFTSNRAWLGLIEGGIKLTVFFLYIWGISYMRDIRRVFQYHGAEHKVINAYEAGEDLTVENIQKHTTVHVRCGTSFLLVFLLASILVFALIPWQFKGAVWQIALKRAAFKLPLLPVVAGLAYEIIKLAGNRKDSKLMRIILGPGLLMQKITTKPPTDEMVEVALKSFQSVKEAEEAECSA